MSAVFSLYVASSHFTNRTPQFILALFCNNNDPTQTNNIPESYSAPRATTRLKQFSRVHAKLLFQRSSQVVRKLAGLDT